jgi:hypothetical protein
MNYSLKETQRKMRKRQIKASFEILLCSKIEMVLEETNQYKNILRETRVCIIKPFTALIKSVKASVFVKNNNKNN